MTAHTTDSKQWICRSRRTYLNVAKWHSTSMYQCLVTDHRRRIKFVLLKFSWRTAYPWHWAYKYHSSTTDAGIRNLTQLLPGRHGQLFYEITTTNTNTTPIHPFIHQPLILLLYTFHASVSHHKSQQPKTRKQTVSNALLSSQSHYTSHIRHRNAHTVGSLQVERTKCVTKTANISDSDSVTCECSDPCPVSREHKALWNWDSQMTLSSSHPSVCISGWLLWHHSLDLILSYSSNEECVVVCSLPPFYNDDEAATWCFHLSLSQCIPVQN